MKLRTFELKDLDEVTKMFIALIDIIYPKHQKGEYNQFLQTVKSWIISKKDIFIVETDEGEIAAFSLSYIEEYKFIQPFYYGDSLYVKKRYRKSKASYLLYANILQIAEEKKLPIHAKGFTSTDASGILEKLLGEPSFIEFIKV